jgi:hypothetical protein
MNLDAVEIRAGDTLDFIVDYNANLNNDQFVWAPEIRRTDLTADETGDSVEFWSAERHFAGPRTPRLGAWEQLAQVLLVSNELMFVD